MGNSSDRVIVIGAGPVGLCLSLALAQAGVRVCLIETLGEHNFLEQTQSHQGQAPEKLTSA